MELVQVKIKGLVITSQYGALQSGDLLRITPDFAKHLVELNAAEYVTQGTEKKPRSKREK